MTRLSMWKRTCAVFALCSTMAIAAPAQTFQKLSNFDGTDGSYPTGYLIQGPDGNIYGIAQGGGAADAGAIFKITPEGKVKTIYSFCAQPNCADGEAPGGLLLGTDGNAYVSTWDGGDLSCRAPYGCGTLVKITSEGGLTILHTFAGADGVSPNPLVQGNDGNFYGTTTIGGDLSCFAPNGCGTVFKITPEGLLTTMHVFENKDGNVPTAALVQGTDGKFYGTTEYGGGNFTCGGDGLGCGTLFRISPSGVLTTLYSFCPRCPGGTLPYWPMIQATDGNFYGTTFDGAIFKLAQTGAVTTLYQFTGGGQFGVIPGGLIQATDGNMYGPTAYGGDTTCNRPAGCGTLFKITLGGVLTNLHNFEFTDGAGSNGGMLQSTTGIFYGSTAYGGNTRPCPGNGCGTAFSLDMGLPPFVAFMHNSSKIGQSSGILGQGFTGSTAVSFNGTPATFKVVSDTVIRATVPAGATTGYVTVTTPSGTLTSNVPFHVIP